MHLVESRDDSWYRSDTTMVDRLAKWVYSDWVDLKVTVPPNSRKIKLVLHLRNTLLNIILFYDVILGSQGIGALEWIERLNTDPEYASQYSSIYNSYAGIKVKTWRNGTWVQQAAIGDIGPALSR